jgi:hypothetical protein
MYNDEMHKDEDSSSWLVTGLNILSFGLIFVPVAGEAMIAYRAWQLARISSVAIEALAVEATELADITAIRSGAYEMLSASNGEAIAKGTEITDLPRLIAEYGGAESDWAKMTSQAWTDNEIKFQVHWYENTNTGLRVEPKVKGGYKSNLLINPDR